MVLFRESIIARGIVRAVVYKKLVEKKTIEEIVVDIVSSLDPTTDVTPSEVAAYIQRYCSYDIDLVDGVSKAIAGFFGPAVGKEAL